MFTCQLQRGVASPDPTRQSIHPLEFPTASEPQKEALVSSTPRKMNGWNPHLFGKENDLNLSPPFLDMFQSLIFQGVS